MPGYTVFVSGVARVQCIEGLPLLGLFYDMGMFGLHEATSLSIILITSAAASAAHS